MISKLPQVGTTIFTVMSNLAKEHSAINLAQGFPNFQPSEKLQRLVFEAMQQGANQYAPMAGLPELRKAIAEKFRIVHGLHVDWEDEITITAGATQAIFSTIAAFVGYGDEVILIEPCYDSYAPSVLTVGGKVVPLRLSAPDYALDFDGLKKLISPKTKMLCINTPNNPTGKIIGKEDLEKIGRLLDGTDILLLSDEVYEHLVFDGKHHTSSLHIASLRNRCIATYSFGKTFHNTGWKMGYTVAPARLTEEIRKVHQFNVFCANHPMQVALAEFLQNKDAYLSLPSFYQQKRDLFAKSMKKTAFKALPCEGTYFSLYDYSGISDLNDLEFCKWMTREHGVAAIPLSPFYTEAPDAKIVRFCFAKTEDVLQEAALKLGGID